MNEQDKNLVFEFVSNKISKDLFLSKLSVDVNNDKNYLNEMLEVAIRNKDADMVECAMILRNRFDYSESGLAILLNKLLREDWHFEHEDIAVLLKELSDPESVETLHQTAMTKFKYLEYNDSLALARKCIYALGKINNSAAIDKLIALTKVSDKDVADLATHQLKKIGHIDSMPI